MSGQEEDNKKGDDFETAQDREEWLRQRGVIIETVEDRRRLRGAQHQRVTTTSTETSVSVGDKVLFVRVPWDMSQPLEQCETFINNSSSGANKSYEDQLSNILAQKAFAASSSNVDLQLLFSKNTTLLSSDSNSLPQVSDDALRSVAERGNCETFRLNPPLPSNDYKSIYVYLDEVGMLKRLPLNKRASDFAFRAGFNPPPKFYGDVYLGRVKFLPNGSNRQNISFYLGPDTNFNDTNNNTTSWLQRAAMENLEFHQRNNVVSVDGQQQQLSVGEDGVPKEEGLYSWTQTLDEIEIVIPLLDQAQTKDISVVFLTKRVRVLLMKHLLVEIELYAPIDTDGCTWTLEKQTTKPKNKLVLSCEKQDGGVSWPRITV